MRFEGKVKTVCPFYVIESKYRISCEGLYYKTKFSLVFDNEDIKKYWQESKCFSVPNYHSCPFARILEEKYEK